MNTAEIIRDVIQREAGYANYSADKGGPTKYGVTLAALSNYRNRPCTAEDIKNLTVAEAGALLTKVYVVDPGLDKIVDDNVRALAADCSVNHGVRVAVKMLQQAAHVFPDGLLGAKTLEAINRMTPAALYSNLCAERVRLYGRIISRDPTQAVFAAGWADRVARFIEGSA